MWLWSVAMLAARAQEPAGAPPETGAEVVDRVVAVVRGQPVLASDLHLDELLARVEPNANLFWTSGRPVQEIEIDAVIVRVVAADVTLYQPTSEAVQERIVALRMAFGQQWNGFLGEHGLDEDRIALAVRRRMVVEKFLLRTLQADPADRDAWLAEAEAILAKLRAEVPVRRIDEREPM